MSVEFRVEGFRDLEKVLAKLPATQSKTIVRKVMRRELKPVADMSNALWPGSSERIVAIGPRLTRGQFSGRAGASEVRLFVGAKGGRYGTPHAHLVEWGTGPRAWDNGKYTGVMPPEPFLQPAWDANKGKVLRGLAAGVWAEIEKKMAGA